MAIWEPEVSHRSYLRTRCVALGGPLHLSEPSFLDLFKRNRVPTSQGDCEVPVNDPRGRTSQAGSSLQVFGGADFDATGTRELGMDWRKQEGFLEEVVCRQR